MRILADRYELVEKIGEGGMSVVWRAHDARLEREVAVKLLRPFVAGEPDRRSRLAREARTLAALSNDHIVRVYDYAEAGEDAFLVMEFIEGCNLARATFHRLPVPWSEAASYARPVCDALAYAHAKGVIHRDLTPANVLIERDTGRVVTTDFGLARIARSGGSATTIGVLLGTPEYWSPEQAMGRRSDEATDMYALGCILYLLLSGSLPFEGDDRLATGLRRAHEDPPSLSALSPGTPSSVVELVDSLLDRDPSRRPSARAAASAIGESSWHVPHRPTVKAARAADWPTVAFAAPTVRIAKSAHRGRRWQIPALAALAGVFGGVVAAAHVLDHGIRAPDVVRLQERVARARILTTMPTATVSVIRVYSTRVARGRVVRQRPEPRSHLQSEANVILMISKGSPFAEVPAISVGAPAETAKGRLKRNGFRVRYRFTPSWSVGKGTVIGLSPNAGTRVRRPATVRIIVSSGPPQRVVPDVQNIDLESAKQQLAARHLRYGIVYRPAHDYLPNHVVVQNPLPGTTTYEGTLVWLAVARTLRWKKVFGDSGSGSYQSVPFTVPAKWRIRYTLDAGFFGDATTEFAWTRDGGLFSDGSFVADTAGAMQLYNVPNGAGTYRLSVMPDSPETSWSLEVDALQ